MMIPGVLISMGGKDWTVPPLTLGQLRRLGPKISAMRTTDARGLTEEQIDAISEIVATALSRNYPEEATPEAVLELLDVGNARAVLEAVLAGSGLRRAEPGEARAVGIGATYTGSSPPPADTATP